MEALLALTFICQTDKMFCRSERRGGRVGAAVRPSYAPHLSEGGEINDCVSLAHTENKLQGVF